MRRGTPLSVLESLEAARGRGDVDEALACYEAQATMVVEPGKTATGLAAIRLGLEQYMALNPTFTVIGRAILDGEGIALHYSHWRLSGTTPEGGAFEATGRTSDVVRRQPGGGWLIAIDNPWGTSILD